MKYAALVILMLLLFGILEVQIGTLYSNDRRENCRIHITDSGMLQRANDWQYYSCLNGYEKD